MKLVSASTLLSLALAAGGVATSCEQQGGNRDSEPLGVVTEILAPISGQIRPGNCSGKEWVVVVKTESKQLDPITGDSITVGNVHPRCLTPEEASKYKVGDGYPRR